MQRNEQELSDLNRQKKSLEERRQSLFNWKRRDMAYLNQLQNELRGENVKTDRRMIEGLLDGTQQVCRRVEIGYEAEYAEIERRGKQLLAQKESDQSDYRRLLQNLDKGGQT